MCSDMPVVKIRLCGFAQKLIDYQVLIWGIMQIDAKTGNAEISGEPQTDNLTAPKPHQLPDLTAGLLLAIAGFTCLSIGDGFIKSLAGGWPGTGVSALRYFIGACGLAVLLFAREGRAGFRFPNPRIQLARGFFVALSTVAFFSSIFLMPLATATAIVFTQPIWTALISALFLKETASRATWGASAIAFIGVLIVLRPSFTELGWVVILPLVAAVSMSGLMIANRKSAGLGNVLLMQFLIAVIGAIFLIAAAVVGHFSGFEPLHIDWPSWYVIGICALVAVTASFGHMLIYLATSRASAAKVSPMVYVQLLVALLIGIIFYDDYPDLLSMAGVGLIVGSGLFLWRSRARV